MASCDISTLPNCFQTQNKFMQQLQRADSASPSSPRMFSTLWLPWMSTARRLNCTKVGLQCISTCFAAGTNNTCWLYSLVHRTECQLRAGPETSIPGGFSHLKCCLHRALMGNAIVCQEGRVGASSYSSQGKLQLQRIAVNTRLPKSSR